MDPKQLAEKFGRMAAASAANAVELQRQREAEAERRKAALEAFTDKLTKVVLSYLQETKDALPKNSFGYNVLGGAVRITIDGFLPVEIREVGGRVELARMRPGASSGPLDRSALVRFGTYSSYRDPLIGRLDDLTREKVGRLIDKMMSDDNRS
jgi:hypothetical protein